MPGCHQPVHDGGDFGIEGVPLTQQLSDALDRLVNYDRQCRMRISAVLDPGSLTTLESRSALLHPPPVTGIYCDRGIGQQAPAGIDFDGLT
jgi:hypothetical protein